MAANNDFIFSENIGLIFSVGGLSGRQAVWGSMVANSSPAYKTFQSLERWLIIH